MSSSGQHVLYGGRVILDFTSGNHQYKVHFVDPASGAVLETRKARGVTTILKIKDKSTPLMIWAEEVYRQELIDSLGDCKSVGRARLLQLIEQAKHAHTRRKDEAADIGSQAHDLIERWFRAKLEDSTEVKPDKSADPRVKACFDAAMKWINQHDFRIVSLEQPVYSVTHDFCGTMDKHAFIDGELCISDWKSAKRIYIENYLQTAAYKAAVDEEEVARIAAKLGRSKKPRKVEARWIIQLGKDTGEFNAVRRGNEFFEDDLQGFLHAYGLFKWDKKYEIPWKKTAAAKAKPSA